MSAFDVAFKQLIGLEGKYSDDATDPGNWTGGKVNAGELKGTMYGVSAAAYPKLNIVGLTLSKAKDIYQSDYWDRMQCDHYADAVAIAVFKEAVNLGVGGATRALQRALKVEPDGVIGQITIGIITSQPPMIVLAKFLGECAYEYTQMANFKIDGKGWLNRVIKTALEAQLTTTELTPDSIK